MMLLSMAKDRVHRHVGGLGREGGVRKGWCTIQAESFRCYKEGRING